MPRIFLKVAYDGTDYNGFALQDDARTIEGALNDAIHEATGEEIHVIGASRTDAGVHAYGNVAVFDTASTIPPDRFHMALNRLLPDDIRVTGSFEVPEVFHPRRTPCRKTYEYRILNREAADPMRRLYTYHYRAPLDVGAMDDAARALTGTHDFTSFCNAQSLSPTRERTLYAAGVVREGDLVIIRVTGAGFLYHMVRIIAGTLIDVGRGHTKASEITEILEAKDRTRAGATAPPQGLVLMGYEFDELKQDGGN